MKDVYVVVSEFTLNGESFYKILSTWDTYGFALQDAEDFEKQGYINIKVQCWSVKGVAD